MVLFFSTMDLECVICWESISEAPASSSQEPEVKKLRSSDRIRGRLHSRSSSSGTPEQLAEESNTTCADLCITKCGHVFHRNCLIDWIKTSKNCPSCRMVTNEKQLGPIFLPVVSDNQNLNCKRKLCRSNAKELEKLQKDLQEVGEVLKPSNVALKCQAAIKLIRNPIQESKSSRVASNVSISNDAKGKEMDKLKKSLEESSQTNIELRNEIVGLKERLDLIEKEKQEMFQRTEKLM